MKISHRSIGSIQDFMSAVENKIQEFNSVESCEDVVAAEEPETREDYIANLSSEIIASFENSGYSHVTADTDSNNLYITVGDTMTEYQVPFDDLTFSDIDEDLDYIMGEIF